MRNSLLRTCFLLVGALAAGIASAAAPTEKDIDRLTDLVVQSMPLGQVFESIGASNPKWPLDDKADKATPEQLACLRSELSTAGYRRAKRVEVVAYAAEHPEFVERDIELLGKGAAELFGKFVMAGAAEGTGGPKADIDAITRSASAAEGMSLMLLTTGKPYAELRKLIGFGSMFDKIAEDDSAALEAKGEDQGTQLGGMLMINAVATCKLPMSIFN